MKENKLEISNDNYKNLVSQISETYSNGYQKTVAAVNYNMVEKHIGK